MMMTMPSVFRARPRAALWRKPKSLLRSALFATGRITPAALILSPTITIAPSWRGLFLKNIFSMMREFISQVKRSPACIQGLKSRFCWITMSAPTFFLAMFLQAKIMGAMLSIFLSCPFLSLNTPVNRCQ